MDIEEIRIFCSVYKYQSLSATARRLGMSNAMVTRKIQNIESILKTKLLHRTTRVVKPTEAGHIFYERSLLLIEQYEANLRSVQSLSEQVSGTIKIGLPNSLSQLYLTPALGEFTQQYPEIKIHIVQGNHLFNLLLEGFDLIILCGEIPDSNYQYTHIRNWTKITCTSPAYLKRFSKPTHPRELAKHNCLDHYDNVSKAWEYHINGKNDSILIQGQISSSNSIDLMNLAKNGIGIVYLPDFIVQQAIHNKTLCPILEEYSPPPLPMSIIYPKGSKTYQRNRLMISLLASLLNSPAHN